MFGWSRRKRSKERGKHIERTKTEQPRRIYYEDASLVLSNSSIRGGKTILVVLDVGTRHLADESGFRVVVLAVPADGQRGRQQQRGGQPAAGAWSAGPAGGGCLRGPKNPR